MHLKMNIKTVPIQQDQFDQAIWQKAQIKNNSGYLDQEYQMTRQFPNIPDYHFRIQDDQAILDLQKCSLNETSLQPINFNKASNKFQDKLNSLLNGLNNVQAITQKNKSTLPIQNHGFYSLEKDYDDQAAIKQAFSRIQTVEVEQKIKQLSLQDNKPKYIKKIKLGDKMKNQGAGPIINLSKQLNKLTINQQDL